MGAIYVVRHGQAAFGTDDYDRLTEIGFAQARLLGAYFGARRVRFDAIFTGTLRRQIETARGILEGHAELGMGLPQERFAGLDEYHSDAIMTAHYGKAPVWDASTAKRDPGLILDHFRELREALLAWADERIQPEGMMAFSRFQEGAVAALNEARSRFPKGHVLIVSSGGPIGAMVAAALQAPPASAIELNLRIRNSSLSEFSSSPKRHQLVSFNGLPHLDTHPDAALSTYV
jgi:broad specificity phosphatase PhoE